MLAVAVALGATSLWGGHSSARRNAVAGYITEVDGVQQRMRLPLTELLVAYRGFSTQVPSSARPKLARAELTLHLLARRLAALPAPPAAARLRVLLLDLVRREAGLAHELDTLAAFIPRFRVLAAEATVANSALARRLAAAAPPKSHVVRGTAKKVAQARAAFAAAATSAAAKQADAVETYDRAVAHVTRKLELLEPPAVLAPAYRAEVRMLRATDAAGAALARELRTQNRAQVPKLSRALAEAARLSGTVAAQRAEIAAVQAYNASVRAIGVSQSRVQAEVARLQRTLG
jgi:hypothetical protein